MSILLQIHLHLLEQIHSLYPSISLATYLGDFLSIRLAIMTLPKTFKQAVFKETGGPLIIEDAQLTPPNKGEVLVKVEACGVCFSDIFAQNNILGGGL